MAVMTVGSTVDNLEFFRNVQAAGIPLAFGMKADFSAFPSGALDEFLRYSTIIFTNETERREIEARMSLSSITDLLYMGNARVIVTTQGRKGSLFYEKKDGGIVSGFVPAARVECPVDTTGSGDAYIAGFLYGYLNGRDTEASCRLGGALAGFIIEAFGCCTNAPSESRLLERFNRKE